MYLLGQICGLIGTLITILMPQCKQKTHMSFCTAAVNGLNALNFTLIGEFGSSVFLCLVAVFQAFVSVWHEKKKTEVTSLETVLFFLLYVGFGVYGMTISEGFQWALNGKFLLELLPIIGALMLMLSVFAKTEQKTRFFLFLNGSAWLVYTAVVGATAFFTCVAAMVSALIAMVKYRKAK